MKILITTGLFPPDIGGPATYVPQMAEALARRGHEICVVAPADRGAACPVVNPPYRLVRFERARAVRYLNYFIEMGRALRAVWMEAGQADLVYINGLQIPAALAARLKRKPAVVKVVGDGAWELLYSRRHTKLNLDKFQTAPGFLAGIARAIHHWAARRASRVITPSQYLKRIVQGWGVPGKRIHVVYNAFTIPAHWAGSGPGEAETSTWTAVTVGRLVPHKRVEDILAALVQVPGIRVIVVGDGPERTRLEQAAQTLGVAEQVQFTGQLPKEQVWKLLAEQASAFILCSTYEGLPHTVLEAAYLNVPVIATAVGGTPEVVQHETTGLLVQPEQPEEIAAAIERLRSSPEMARRLAEAAHQQVLEFNFERMLTETEAVLREAIECAS